MKKEPTSTSDGDYKYSDLIMNNPDGLSPQDALRSFGIQSMLTLLQDARYERAFVSDEVNRIRDIYEQEGHIGDAFPTLAFTNDEQGIINEKYTEIETYMNETIDKFIMGVEPWTSSTTMWPRWRRWAWRTCWLSIRLPMTAT